jgi:hypothetical protein
MRGCPRIHCHRFGEAEVEHPGPHLARQAVERALQDDVGRLQVAMDDSLLVRGHERLADLARNGECDGDRKRSTVEPIGQRRSLDQLEDQGSDAVRFFQAVDGADVRVIECGERPRFTREARAPFGVGGEVRREDLDRDVAPELVVAGAVDLAHPAGAERGDDCVGANPAIDHRRRPRGNGGDGNRRALEEPGGRRLELEQRRYFLPQRLVSVAGLEKERRALLRLPRQRPMVQVRDQIAAVTRHGALSEVRPRQCERPPAVRDGRYGRPSRRPCSRAPVARVGFANAPSDHRTIVPPPRRRRGPRVLDSVWP